MNSNRPGNNTDELVISVLGNEDDVTWDQLLRGTLDGPGSPNNVIIDKVTRYMKEKLSFPRDWTLWSFGRGTISCIRT